MFDDPKKDLDRLNAQLLSEYSREEEIPDSDWLDDELREARALMDNDYSRSPARGGSVYDYDEEADDDGMALYSDDPRLREEKPKKAKKEKGIGGLVFLACLESLGIVAVLVWWVLWLL